MRHVLGLDLGQVSEPTALVVLEVNIERPIRLSRHTEQGVIKSGVVYMGPDQMPVTEHPPLCYVVRHIERIGPGVSYPDILKKVEALFGQLAEPILAIDTTGVGQAILELFQQAKLASQAISVSGGETATHEGVIARVPKKDLIAASQLLLQKDELKIARGLPLAEALHRDLRDYRLEVLLHAGAGGSIKWRERAQDDLILALAIAVWVARANFHPPAPALGHRSCSSWAADYWSRPWSGRG